MIRVTAWPTVEWLHNRRADREPVETGPRVPVADHRHVAGTIRHRDARRAPLNRLSTLLRRSAASCVQVQTTSWIQTPDGELPVEVVLERSGRRIAVCFSKRYESDSEARDALVLVYGGFDALYRVRRARSEEQVQDVAYALMCDLPSWFTLQGRMKAGRLASALAVVSVHTGIGKRRSLSGGCTMERIRLCVASDWVRSFESVLDAARSGQEGMPPHGSP